MLTKSTEIKIGNNGESCTIRITPLFLQDHNEPWAPNEIYDISRIRENDTDESIGKIIVDDRMDWHYEGEHKLSDDEVEQIARFVLMQI